MYDLLTEPLIPVLRPGEKTPERASLPDLYVLLLADGIESFPGLTPHQGQAWYQFLAQLGALAQLRAGSPSPPRRPEEWRDALLSLTPDQPITAWSLVADEPSHPALFQPPTDLWTAFKPLAETPDSLDVLVTAKNHDRKQHQAVAAAPHLWLYALVTLQTTQGFSGRGNQGIARMNGGFASRVLIDRRPNARWGPRVARGMRMLLHRRQEILKSAGDGMFRAEGGIALMWLEDWDTDSALQITDLDPYFIEICRRVRLTALADDRMRAYYRAAEKPRVDAKALKGNLADPWVPINRDKGEPTALTVSANGFDYRLAQRILLDRKTLTPPAALKKLPHEAREDSEIHMAVLVRGQGKTEGLHERVIPLPESIAAYLDSPDHADSHTLATLSKGMVDDAAQTRRVLRQALLVFYQGPEHPNFKRGDADPLAARFDRIVDERFFAELFDAPDIGTDATLSSWHRFLRREAQNLAREVWENHSPPRARREKARAASEALFYRGLRKLLPGAFESSDYTTEAAI